MCLPKRAPPTPPSDSIIVRNQSFDSVRGWLIVSVIIGHIVLGSIHDQFVRYAIYAVHMPLFIALTGYLINANKLRESSVVQSIARYWSRLVIPFIPAFAFFTGTLLVHAAMEGRLSVSLLLAYLTKPYYHLWFIPTLLIWIGSLVLILKARLPILLLCVLCAPLSLAWAGLDSLAIPQVLLSKKVFFYAYFFFLGMVCRSYLDSWHQIVKRLLLPLIAVSVICAGFYIQQCGLPKTAFVALAWFILNTILVLLTLNWILNEHRPQPAKLITLMGRHSLPIYLWHVLPMFLLKGFNIHQTYPSLYYLLSIASCILIVYMVAKFENRYSTLNRWFYGVESAAIEQR